MHDLMIADSPSPVGALASVIVNKAYVHNDVIFSPKCHTSVICNKYSSVCKGLTFDTRELYETRRTYSL